MNRKPFILASLIILSSMMVCSFSFAQAGGSLSLEEQVRGILIRNGIPGTDTALIEKISDEALALPEFVDLLSHGKIQAETYLRNILKHESEWALQATNYSTVSLVSLSEAMKKGVDTQLVSLDFSTELREKAESTLLAAFQANPDLFVNQNAKLLQGYLPVLPFGHDLSIAQWSHLHEMLMGNGLLTLVLERYRQSWLTHLENNSAKLVAILKDQSYILGEDSAAIQSANDYIFGLYFVAANAPLAIRVPLLNAISALPLEHRIQARTSIRSMDSNQGPSLGMNDLLNQDIRERTLLLLNDEQRIDSISDEQFAWLVKNDLNTAKRYFKIYLERILMPDLKNSDLNTAEWAKGMPEPIETIVSAVLKSDNEVSKNIILDFALNGSIQLKKVEDLLDVAYINVPENSPVRARRSFFFSNSDQDFKAYLDGIIDDPQALVKHLITEPELVSQLLKTEITAETAVKLLAAQKRILIFARSGSKQILDVLKLYDRLIQIELKNEGMMSVAQFHEAIVTQTELYEKSTRYFTGGTRETATQRHMRVENFKQLRSQFDLYVSWIEIHLRLWSESDLGLIREAIADFRVSASTILTEALPCGPLMHGFDFSEN